MKPSTKKISTSQAQFGQKRLFSMQFTWLNKHMKALVSKKLSALVMKDISDFFIFRKLGYKGTHI